MPEAEEVSEWVRAWGDDLYRYALLRVQDRELASDLVQEAFLAAWRARDTFHGESSRKTWLIAILKHKIVDHIRQRVRQRKLDEVLEEDPASPWFRDDHAWREPQQAWRDDPARLCQDQAFLRALQDCLRRLPERQRHVFVLRELQGEDGEHVCNACGITTTNLHVLMHRARLALRHCLRTHGFGASS